MKFPKKSMAVVASVACSAALACSLSGCGPAIPGAAPTNGNNQQNTPVEQVESEDSDVVDHGSVDAENIDNVKIRSCKLERDYSGNKRAVVTFEWTNNSDEAAAFYLNYTVTAYQDGSEIETTFGNGGDWHEYSKKIKPGKTQTFKMMFESNTKDDIEIEVTGWASSDLVAAKTFKM